MLSGSVPGRCSSSTPRSSPMSDSPSTTPHSWTARARIAAAAHRRLPHHFHRQLRPTLAPPQPHRHLARALRAPPLIESRRAGHRGARHGGEALLHGASSPSSPLSPSLPPISFSIFPPLTPVPPATSIEPGNLLHCQRR